MQPTTRNFYNRSQDAVIRVYAEAANMIEAQRAQRVISKSASVEQNKSRDAVKRRG
jgi:hypothetical protein